jgi:hypothetical protein
MLNHLKIMMLAGIVLVASCKKEDDHSHDENIDPNKRGNMILEFDNRVGNLNLVLDSPFYSNSLGQNFTISKFDYYISNIVLINENGTEFIYPQDSSYFLVKENEADRQEISLSGIPEGNYSGVKFIIGVDSLRNTKPISERTGDLDVTGAAAGMYWTWNSGYIFMKMEGSFLDTGSYLFHIGGYGGFSAPTINNIKTVNLSFGTERAEVREAHGDEGPAAHIYVDAKVVVDGTNKVDFVQTPVVMFSPYSTSIANNYMSMFTVDHIHNHEH